MSERAHPTRSALQSRQLEQFRQLLGHILPANPFYTAKLGSVAPTIQSSEDISRLPFTTKAELVRDQQSHPPFGTNLTYPLDHYTRYHQTSGTTGRPLRWLDTPETWNWMVDRWLDIFRAAGLTDQDRIVFAFSFGPYLGFWLAFEAGAKLGAMCLPAGGMSSSARVQMILSAHATVLCCTPTYALRLASVANEEKADLSSGQLRRIIVAGEAGGSILATRSQLEVLWPGAEVFDHHGMTETGPVTYQCPVQPGRLHVMDEAFFAEVLDPKTDQPVAPGETGELILTNFGRVGSPLIRYRTGDLVRKGEGSLETPCRCGTYELTLEGGILGRVDDMIIVRGVNVYPSAVEEVIRGIPEVSEYQVKVSKHQHVTELKVVVEPTRDCHDVPALLETVAARFHATFALRIVVESATEVLPRFEMKARRWLHS